MAEPCPICQHAKREAIDAACLSGRHVAVIARQFRLNPEVLAVHISHQSVMGRFSKYVDDRETAQTQVQTTDTASIPEPRYDERDHAQYILTMLDNGDLVEVRVEPEDPLQLVKRYLGKAAEAWKQVEDDRRTLEHLQLLLEEAFAQG